jgi:hypothetical protein
MYCTSVAQLPLAYSLTMCQLQLRRYITLNALLTFSNGDLNLKRPHVVTTTRNNLQSYYILTNMLQNDFHLLFSLNYKPLPYLLKGYGNNNNNNNNNNNFNFKKTLYYIAHNFLNFTKLLKFSNMREICSQSTTFDQLEA